MVEKMRLPENIRLACQTRIKGDISIRRPAIDELDIKLFLKQLDDPDETNIGMEKNLAILFTDIKNYTHFAELYPAYDIVHVLNRYYQTMNEIIMKHRGTISDVAGDGILALFGIMENGKNSVLDAINSVREMNTALNLFNEYLNEMFGWSFYIRTGISFGKVIVGNFEIGKLKKISVFGDEVNFAHRIENINKEFNTQVLISQSAYDEIQGSVEILNVHSTRLKGKSGEYKLYEIKI
jgi:adenylate cyclase